MKLICEDIPQHGLLLVDPSDPFSEKIRLSLTRKLAALAESIRFPCVALLNESNQPIVAYKLVWDLENANGTRQVDEKSFASIGELMGLGPGPGQEGNFDDPRIEPGRFRLFSTNTRMPVTTESTVEQSAGINAGTGGVPLVWYEEESTGYVRATITIDGAFYNDGRFVGPDATGYFSVVRAEVMAKFDLLQDISRHSESGRPLPALFEQLRESARPTRYRPHMTAKEVYDFYRSIFTEEVFSMRNACGEAEAVHLILKELKREWPDLKKV